MNTTMNKELLINRYKRGVEGAVQSGHLTVLEANEVLKLIATKKDLVRIAMMPMQMQDHTELFAGFHYFTDDAARAEYETPYSFDEYSVHGTSLTVAKVAYYEDCEDYICPENGQMYDREDTWSYAIHIYPR